MDVDQVSTFLGLLSFLALVIGAGTIGLLVTGRVGKLRPYLDLLLPLALAIALVSTLGSLYYSAVEHYRPCRLCWWQRIMMYPLVSVFAVALLRRDRAAALGGLPLALIGLGYSIYHKQLQWFPDQGSSCEADAPCTSVWVDTFGFVSIPFMAGAGFLAIAALLIAQLVLDRQVDKTSQSAIHEPLEQSA